MSLQHILRCFSIIDTRDVKLDVAVFDSYTLLDGSRCKNSTIILFLRT